VVALLLALTLLWSAGPAGAAQLDAETATDTERAGEELSAFDAVILGVVEGVTEYLPVSSTGHLIVTQRILDVGQDDATRDAMDAYTVVIQVGAIVAVLILYWRRVERMVLGLLGRDPEGLRMVGVVLAAFLPAVVMALTLGDVIKDELLEVGPVVVAWILGAFVIFLTAPRFRDAARGRALESLLARQALLIGVAQVVAFWPGVSRSFVTIIGGLLVGLSLPAAVEFSFLLGLATLTAATGYTLVTDGSTINEAYGLAMPALGIVAAFISAALAVKWMVGYLNRHDLTIFGWYRLGIAAVTIALLATGVV